MYGGTDHAKQILAKARVGSTFKVVERNEGSWLAIFLWQCISLCSLIHSINLRLKLMFRKSIWKFYVCIPNSIHSFFISALQCISDCVQRKNLYILSTHRVTIMDHEQATFRRIWQRSLWKTTLSCKPPSGRSSNNNEYLDSIKKEFAYFFEGICFHTRV